MKKNKLNQDEMGKILGKGRSMVGYYANGKSNPDPNTIVKIANYFGITIDELILTNLRKPKDYTFIARNPAQEGTIMYGDPESEIRHLNEKVHLLRKQIEDLQEHVSTQNMLIRELKKAERKK